MYEELAVLAAFTFIYSVISGRVEKMATSGPIIFVFVGLVFGPLGLDWFKDDVSRVEFRVLVDLTLALILFIDAANADISVLRRQIEIPSRMLLVGLPGAIALGFGVAVFLFDAITLFEAAILATMLAATDAALGKAVVANKDVPARLREGLNCESGLNDGLCVPILLIFIALAHGTAKEGVGFGLMLVLKEIGIGAIVGLALAFGGAWLLKTLSIKGLGQCRLGADSSPGSCIHLLQYRTEPSRQRVHRRLHGRAAVRIHRQGCHTQAGHAGRGHC